MMKDDLAKMEAYVKELDALKKYDELKRVAAEVSELRAVLSQTTAEKDKLEHELLDAKKQITDMDRLKGCLELTQAELSQLKEAKVILDKGDITLEEAVHEFIIAKEEEIKNRIDKELAQIKADFDTRVPELICERLIAILGKQPWPEQIAGLIDERVQGKVKSRLDDEFERRVKEEAAERLKRLKLTEWRRFIDNETATLTSSLNGLVAELKGPWLFTCDRCHTNVRTLVGPHQVAALLSGEYIAECPGCIDLNFPPPPFTVAHKIEGSNLKAMLRIYLSRKGFPDKTD